MNRVKAFDCRWSMGASVALAIGFAPLDAFAQAAPPPPAAPPPAAAAAPAAPAAVPAPAAEPVAAAPAPPPPDVAPPPPPPPPAEAAPPPPPPAPTEDEKLPSIDVGAWLRAGLQFQNGSDPKKLNDQHFDTVYGELHLGGKVHKNVSYTLNFNANGFAGTAGIMDAIIGLDFQDEFHIWSGQLLTPVDRTNFSGPFFISPWNYPGVFVQYLPGAPVITPHGEDHNGRSVGTVVWGDIDKGFFKYYASMMNLQNEAQSPLFSGRLAINPIGKEPGYYGSSTYYGDQNILGFAIGGQYQHKGSIGGVPAAGGPAPTKDYGEFNADILAEFKLGDSGTLTGEGAYYHFAGDYEPANDMFFLVASFLTPNVGPGKLQPLFRFEDATRKLAAATGTPGETLTQEDVQLAYVVKEAQMRGLIGFSHVDWKQDGGAPDKIGNAIEIGLQTIQF